MTEASKAASAANSSATAADEAAKRANAASESIENMTVSAESVEASEKADVQKQSLDDHVNLHFKIPQGKQGIQGQKGERGDAGPQGNQGDMGPRGEQGIQGNPGKDATINGKSAVTLKGSGIVNVSEADESGAITVSASANKHWDISIEAADWDEADENWAGMTATFKAEKTCSGMTESTDISGITFTGGDRNAAAIWQYLRPGTDTVTLFSATKPSAAFNLRLTEVK